MIDEDMVDTMGDYMLEAMEQKMAISAMTLILAMGSNMIWTITRTLCLIIFNKILEINIHIYGYLNQPTAQNMI